MIFLPFILGGSSIGEPIGCGWGTWPPCGG